MISNLRRPREKVHWTERPRRAQEKRTENKGAHKSYPEGGAPEATMTKITGGRPPQRLRSNVEIKKALGKGRARAAYQTVEKKKQIQVRGQRRPSRDSKH